MTDPNDKEVVRSFVMGFVLAGVYTPRHSQVAADIGWELTVNSDGEPVFLAPSGTRYRVVVVIDDDD